MRKKINKKGEFTRCLKGKLNRAKLKWDVCKKVKTKVKHSVTLHIRTDKYAFAEIGEHKSAGCHVHLLKLVHKIYLDIKLETLKKKYFTATIIYLNLTSI